MPASPDARRPSRTPRLQVERLDIRLAPSASAAPRVQPVYPNDPGFSSQWGLDDGGGFDVDAPEAWRVTTGSRATIIAVLDSGIDLKNPEFRGRLWVNPSASRPGRPVYGWNFVREDGNVQDDYGHGTHVAGVLGAAAGNRRGIAGLDWNARIMVLKIFDAHGNGEPEAAAAAVRFAVDHGARIINASWATDEYSQALYDAVAYAAARGVVLVTGAGNRAADLDAAPVYPASFDLPNILVATAVDRSGGLADFASYGAATVDVGAPGVDVYSTYASRSRFATLSGTSMAVSFATGVVSLVAGLHPDWSAERLIQHVEACVRPLPGLVGKTSTGGMVDAARAVGAGDPGRGGVVPTASPGRPRPPVPRWVRPSPTPPLRPAVVRGDSGVLETSMSAGSLRKAPSIALPRFGGPG